jgi:dTDP-glucose 4,6-dehydratase
MKTVLVTGAAGFIGGHFVRRLYRDRPDHRIVVVDALTYAGRTANLPTDAERSGRYEFRHGDVRDAVLMSHLVARSDVVVHLAAESHVTRSILDDRPFFETDVLGTHTVARAVAEHRDRVERFIYVSSSEVYGTALTQKMDEDHPLNPVNPYGAAKCGADRLVYASWATHGIPAVIVRPFNAFGPRQHLEKVIPRFVTSCLLGEPLVVHGDGSAARDWTFVDDLCAALDRLLDADPGRIVGQAVNVGTGRHRTVLEVARAVRELMGADGSPIVFAGDRPGQIARHTCDASKAEGLLGWVPRVAFEDGLARTIDWYRRHEAWWRSQVAARHSTIVTASGALEPH